MEEFDLDGAIIKQLIRIECDQQRKWYTEKEFRGNVKLLGRDGRYGVSNILSRKILILSYLKTKDSFYLTLALLDTVMK